MTGTVAKYFDDKGFGFIKPVTGGKDIFFHVKAVREGAELLRVGLEVEYDEGRDRDDRPKAVRVKVAS